MSKLLYFVPLFLLAGCLGKSPSAPQYWSIEARLPTGAVSLPKADVAMARLFRVNVRAPYSGAMIALMRPDGSIAMDPCNSFAARPDTLAEGAAYDVIASCGRYKTVVMSSLSTQGERLDIDVTRLTLDARDAGSLKAVVELTLSVTSITTNGMGQTRVYRGAATADASGGDYTQAFSTAFSDALRQALARITNDR